MSKILPYSREAAEEPYMALLLVSSTLELTTNMLKALNNQKKEDKVNYRLYVHICEKVEDVLRSHLPKLHVDYIVILLDPRIYSCIKDATRNISHLRLVYPCARMCLVNGYSGIKLAEMGVSYMDLSKFRDSQDLFLLHGDVTNTVKCNYLAKRVLCLASAAVGIKSGVPLVFGLHSATTESKSRHSTRPANISKRLGTDTETDSFFSFGSSM